MKRYRRYFFDLDGTLYLSGRPLPGVPEALTELRARGARLTFVSNNPLHSTVEYAERLSAIGIPARADEVFTSVTATVAYLHQHHRGEACYVIGEEPLRAALRAAGQPLTDDPLLTRVVVVSWDRNFHYKQLNDALQAMRRGAIAIATHPDRTCPVEGGEVADVGGMIGAVEGVTGQRIEVVCGKPSPLLLQLALAGEDISPSECLMVGDRWQTDIAMGRRAGFDTALVLTGGTSEAQARALSADARPMYILASAAELVAGWAPQAREAGGPRGG